MIERIKLLLGESANNFTDGQIAIFYELAVQEIKDYTGRDTLNKGLEITAEYMTMLKCNRIGSEGLSSESYSGASYNYINDYPPEVKRTLDRHRVVNSYA